MWFDRLTTLSRVEGPKGTWQSRLAEEICSGEVLYYSGSLRQMRSPRSRINRVTRDDNC